MSQEQDWKSKEPEGGVGSAWWKYSREVKEVETEWAKGRNGRCDQNGKKEGEIMGRNKITSLSKMGSLGRVLGENFIVWFWSSFDLSCLVKKRPWFSECGRRETNWKATAILQARHNEHWTRIFRFGIYFTICSFEKSKTAQGDYNKRFQIGK